MAKQTKVIALIFFTVWLMTLGILLYLLLDSSVTNSYLLEGYADCRAHRDYLSAQAMGRLNRKVMEERIPDVLWAAGDGTRQVSPGEFEIRYDEQGRYAASRFGASLTPGFEEGD